MKTIFEVEDFTGRNKEPIYIAHTSGEAAIITWISGTESVRKDGSGRRIYLAQINTDGMSVDIGGTWSEAVKFLNNSNYIAIPKEWLSISKEHIVKKLKGWV